ncbi:hypothetical protein [Mycoplasma parvum]|uniref:Uncharacterized protein n=1 Tax=Mycoplasma parvum str. Indiana TaxID=1403316 RepID=U5NCB4_9MOLU|nr:hypothetical protein [Mycoplasma parvum]AGX88950.1 hypothetical protein PRV_00925 [Mycoplasma parvum str. Indiana]
MGFFGLKKTSLNVDGREVIVDESTITFSPDEKNPFKEWEKDENQKNKKFVIFGICLNGEFRPDILQKWQQIQKGDGSHEIRNTIKKGLKIIDEMLRKKINKWVGCQDKDLIDENGEIGVGFLEQMFIMNEDGGAVDLLIEN